VRKSEYDFEIQKLGLRIKELRAQQNLTQETLSAICDIDVRTIQRIEKGQQNITLNILFTIAGALNVKPHELIISSYPD
jgi:transcriptional regulator with XRE-family HTH domain